MRDADGMPASKTDLRAALTAARRGYPPAEREAARAAIRGHVLADCLAEAWTCVAAYEPLRNEPGSVELLTGLVQAGARVLVPVTLADLDLDWVEWSGSSRSLGRAAIGAASAVLVPALAVARDGTRLGRGGGSYDRALPRCSPGTTLLALLFEGELVDELPREPWDRAVTDVVLPSGRVRL